MACVGRALACALSASVAAACGGGGEPRRPESGASCAFGAVRESVTVGRAVVLGCGRAPDGTRIELVARNGSCLILQGLPGGERGCGVAPGRGEPALRNPYFVQRRPRGRIELYGETRGDVRRVVVRYRDRRRVRTRGATLIEAHETQALRAAHISRPFGYFVAFVPAAARDIVVEGHDTARRLGSLRFAPILRSLHPRVFIVAPS